jgi:hypothetical protein
MEYINQPIDQAMKLVLEASPSMHGSDKLFE